MIQKTIIWILHCSIFLTSAGGTLPTIEVQLATYYKYYTLQIQI